MYSDFLSFLPNALSLLQGPNQNMFYISLGSSRVWQFFRISLFLMTSTVLKSTGQIFLECPSTEIFLIYFSWFDWGCGFGRGWPLRQSAILITSYQNYIPSTWLTTVENLDCLAELVVVRFFHRTVISSRILLRERFISASPCIYLFNHLSISVWIHGYLFCTLGYNPILLYFVVQIISALAIGSSFSELLCPLTYPITVGWVGFCVLSTSYLLALPDAPGTCILSSCFACERLHSLFVFILVCFPRVHPQVRLRLALKKDKFVKILRVSIKEIEIVCKTFKPIERGRKRINKMCSIQQAFETEGKKGNNDLIKFLRIVCHFLLLGTGMYDLEGCFKQGFWMEADSSLSFQEKDSRFLQNVLDAQT